MRWLGLDWDEGVEVGGPTRRTSRVCASTGTARSPWTCSSGTGVLQLRTPDQLDAFRKEAQAAGRRRHTTGASSSTPQRPRPELPPGSRPRSEWRCRGRVRPLPRLVRDEVTFDHDQVDDFVILRSDGSPTITWPARSTMSTSRSPMSCGARTSCPPRRNTSSSPSDGGHPPTYAHLALLMGPDGKKLSKRHGHTALNAYRDAGILPEAMVNYSGAARLVAGEDETIVSLADMIERFDIDEVTKNPTIFDNDKLEWMNGVYIRELSIGRLRRPDQPLVETHLGRSSTGQRRPARAIAPHVQERAKRLTEVAEQVAFIFGDVVYDEPLGKRS